MCFVEENRVITTILVKVSHLNRALCGINDFSQRGYQQILQRGPPG